jgi:exonuclease VII small subunit
VRAIHDLERAIHVWGLVRDTVQQAVYEVLARCEEQEDSVETSLAVARGRSYIDRCNTSILAAKERIEELEKKGLETQIPDSDAPN